MTLAPEHLEFLRTQRMAAMVTVGADGRPKACRVGIAFVDGHLWSSGTEGRVRTKRLRRDPRCTLYLQDAKAGYLCVETTVTILDGPDAPELTLKWMRIMQGKPTGPIDWFGRERDEPDFLRAAAKEHRIMYQFELERSYGML